MTRRVGEEEACHGSTLTGGRKERKEGDDFGIRWKILIMVKRLVIPGRAIFALASLPIFAPESLDQPHIFDLNFKYAFDSIDDVTSQAACILWA